jgi:hypothetical protein
VHSDLFPHFLFELRPIPLTMSNGLLLARELDERLGLSQLISHNDCKLLAPCAWRGEAFLAEQKKKGQPELAQLALPTRGTTG